jgi:hypothetical protein
VGLTPSPTCLPGQGGSRKGDAASRQRNGSLERQASSESRRRFFLFSRSKSFEKAYLATDYVVQIDGRAVLLRPNECSSRGRQGSVALQRAWRGLHYGVQPLQPAAREADEPGRARRALASVRRRGWRFVEGNGQGRDKSWPPEKSVRVFGVTRSGAAAVGRRFRQNAIIFDELHRPAELVHLS